MVHCRFFNRLYTEYQQLCHVKELQLEASNQNRDDIMHKQVSLNANVCVCVCVLCV